MDKSDIGVAQGLKGELTTDYFEFYCTKCGERLPSVVFHSVHSVGIQLLAYCRPCHFPYIFKVKTEPALGPIQITREFGRASYRLYDRRRLKQMRREQDRFNI